MFGGFSHVSEIDPQGLFAYVKLMTIRTILTIPDSKLREICAPIEKVDDSVKKLVDDMFDTMYDAPGVGLAAIQIGELRRLFVLDVAKDGKPPKPLVFINPKIVWTSQDHSTYEEGCLSIPGYYEEVERPAKVRVQFLNRDGEEQEMEAEGLLSTCIQHELDHLDGKLFIDYLSKLKRDRVMKKYTKFAKMSGKLAS